MEDPTLLPLVQPIHQLHLVLGQREIEYINVLLYPAWVRALGQDDYAVLNGVAQQHLGRRAIVRLGDLLHLRVVQEAGQRLAVLGALVVGRAGRA